MPHVANLFCWKVRRVETVDRYLQRGGKITVCPPAYCAPSPQYHWFVAVAPIKLKPLRVPEWKHLPSEATIEILVPDPPYGPDTTAGHQFAKYKSGLTIAELRDELHCGRRKILVDLFHGYIRLVGAPPPPRPSWIRPPKPSHPWEEFAGDATIVVLAKSNPKKAGSKAFQRFELYRTGMSVAEFRTAGGMRRVLLRDVKHGWVSVAQ